MKMHSAHNILFLEFRYTLIFVIRWSILSLFIGFLSGSASAFFLVALEYATNTRLEYPNLLFILPFAGLFIGFVYHTWGESVVKGNNQLIEQIHNPRKVIPLRMTPFVLIGTILTHLFGGSAGREGTAVQMGASLADQLTHINRIKIFRRMLGRIRPIDRKMLLIAGISGGFASVFGTPIAGAIFGLEVFLLGRLQFDAILPSLLTAIIADYVTQSLWSVGHTQYFVPFVPNLDSIGLCISIFCGIGFGLAARFFSASTHFVTKLFSKWISYPPFRPLVGGFLFATIVILTDTYRYIGLGIPEIVESFEKQQSIFSFLIKSLYTSFTLASGFKGGEVTPLFYIGSHLGNAFSQFLPLPLPLLASMGFVAVFAGAANTPLACTIMAIELFGIQVGVYASIACVFAYLSSGHSGIYSSQLLGSNSKIRNNQRKNNLL